MALAARATGVSSGPNVSSAHMPSGGRNVASVAFSAIDELAPKAEVLADPNYNFQGFSEWMSERERKAPEKPISTPHGTVDAPTSLFVTLLSQEQNGQDTAAPTGNAKRSFQSMLSKAIRAYEGTAHVLSGAPASRGGALSLSL